MTFNKLYKLFLENSNDEVYLNLARNPEENKEILQRMVKKYAKINGYDIGIVYRSDKTPFTIFDKNKFTYNAHAKALDIAVFHFSNSYEVASSYQGVVRSFYLNIEDPLRINADGKQWFETVSDITDQLHVYNSDASKELAKLKRELGMWGDIEWNDLTPKDQKRLEELSYKAELSLRNKKITIYDGFIIKNSQDIGIKGLQGNEVSPGSTIIGVFKPNQIKLSDPVTYDDSGKVIPLSSRFDSSKDDIRY